MEGNKQWLGPEMVCGRLRSQGASIRAYYSIHCVLLMEGGYGIVHGQTVLVGGGHPVGMPVGTRRNAGPDEGVTAETGA